MNTVIQEYQIYSGSEVRRINDYNSKVVAVIAQTYRQYPQTHNELMRFVEEPNTTTVVALQ